MVASFCLPTSGVSASSCSTRAVQPVAWGMCVAQDGYEGSPTQNYKFTSNFFFGSLVFISVCVFNAWPKATLLFPVWPRDAKSLDTPVEAYPHKLHVVLLVLFILAVSVVSTFSPAVDYVHAFFENSLFKLFACFYYSFSY